MQNLQNKVNQNAISYKWLPQIMSAIEKNPNFWQTPIDLQVLLLEHVPNAVIATDIEGNIIYWNRFAQEIFQWKSEEAIGKNICKLLVNDNIQLAEATLLNLKQSEWWQGELVVQRKNGSFFVAEVTNAIIREPNAQIEGFVGIYIDATERKQAEMALKQSEAKLQAIFNNSLQAIVLIDQEQRIQAFNKTANKWAERIYNKPLCQGDAIRNFLLPEDCQKFHQNFQRAIQGKFIKFEQELQGFDGNSYWFEISYDPVLNEQEASMKGVVVNCRDITYRVQAEASLEHKSQREHALNRFTRTLRSYLDVETICSIAATEISQMLQVEHVEIQQYLPTKQVWLTVAEYPPQTGVLNNLSVEVPDVDNEVTRQLKQLEVVKHKDIGSEEAGRLMNPNYTGNWLLVPLHFQQSLWGSLSLMKASLDYEWHSEQVEWISAIADQLALAIQQAQLYQQSSALNAYLESQVQERTAELQQKVQELQQLNVLKDDFLSTVSHELRTPLANMKMAIQMLKLVADSSDRRQRYLDILESECARETDLINDLLDLQRLEVANYSISLEKIKLQDWLLSIIEPFLSRAQQHKQKLAVNMPADLPLLDTDKTSLGRIIAELLHNACKYTPPGNEIIFSVSCASHLTAQPVINFTISNQAEIPAQELPRIFEKFYRVPNADPWKQGGTGLGLALVQQLLDKMEGTIDVNSGNAWTTFIVQIPVSPSQQLREKSHRILH